MELAGVLAARTNRPEVRAFRCKPCYRVFMYIVEGGALREW
jgi:hypothetical protein